jgi:hypothetical protein
MAIFFVPAGELHVSGKGHLWTFIVAAVLLSWSVGPAFRDFTRRLWIPRGRALSWDESALPSVHENHRKSDPLVADESFYQ